jgi:ADP-heptose:LPS heptosyltransferase
MIADPRQFPLTPILEVDRPIRRIAIFRALYLGDLICAIPALRALRCRFPEAEITLIGLPWAADLVARLPSVDLLVPFPGYHGITEVPFRPTTTRAFLDWAVSYRFDLALQMHGSGAVSNGFLAALGARASLGYGSDADDRLTTRVPWNEDEHEIDRWLRLVAALGATTDTADVRWPVLPAEEARAAQLLGRLGPEGPVVGLHAGAKDAARRWPADRFATLANRLSNELGARIVLTGSETERDATAAIARTTACPVLDLAGQTDLATFAALIARLDLLITNDTGASHLAAATGTPSVVLFGPSRPERWAPRDRMLHRVIDAALHDPTEDQAAALARLPVAPVFEASAQALATSGHRHRYGPSRDAVPQQEASCAV